MKEALITKIISKEYSIRLNDGRTLIASLAGKMRQYDYPVVGDIVEYEKYDDRYIIERIKKRKNYLIRPNLANIDQVIVVMSSVNPDFSYELCNRLIMLIEYSDIKPIILVTKSDLIDDNKVKEILSYYHNLGYEAYESGIDDEVIFIKTLLKDKITVLAGQSGVGKSTFVNKLNPLLNLKTQEISKALNRGKHTTRHVELFECFGGLLADTPGFSSIDLSSVDKNLLGYKISAFEPYLDKCQFLDCKHLNEPVCGIKSALNEGLIPESFYETYKNLMNFLLSNNLKANAHRTLK